MHPTLNAPATREELLHELARVLLRSHQFDEVAPRDGDILYAAVLQLPPSSDPWEVESLRHALRHVVGSGRSLDVPATLAMLGLSTEQKPNVRTGVPVYLALQDRRWFRSRLPDTPRPAWFPVELEQAVVPILDRELLTIVLDKMALTVAQLAAQLDPDLDAHYEAMINELWQRAKEHKTEIEVELERAIRRAASRAVPAGWSGGSWADLVAGWTGPWLLNTLADELIPAVRHQAISPDEDEKEQTGGQPGVASLTAGLRSGARLTYLLLRLRHIRAGLPKAEAKREAARQAWPSVGLAQALGNADKADFDRRRRHPDGSP